MSASETSEKFVFNSCMVNCMSRCLLKIHVQQNKILSVETDDTGEDIYGSHQVRACLRGRSIRKRVESPDRLKYPLKRTGPRGSGNFERISWNEALESIAERMKKVKEKYGPEAFYINYGTGTIGSVMSKSCPSNASILARLLNCFGGQLSSYSSYSFSQIEAGMRCTYGESWRSSNSLSDIVNSKLAVFFGNNPAETNMSGGGLIYDLVTAKQKSNVKVIVIDPRHTDTVNTAADQWIPIYPGTDAALVSALAYILISEELIDESFLARYCVGYDENSLPEGIDPGSSYKSYILGDGRDGIPKTPGWAAPITGIPEDIIVKLAREIGQSKPAYISQGWGPQRHYNGEFTARAISMLSILTGNVGIRGGNTGAREGGVMLDWPQLPVLENPVKAAIPVFMWSEAIARGSEMTALKDGVQGAEQLNVPIKFLWNYAGNCLINQHSDINRTKKIIGDESLCDTIVVVDNFMTSSAMYADFLLPAVTNLEENDFAVQALNSASEMSYVIFSQKAIEPMYECRSIYDICAELAERLGFRDKFTEGRSRDQWLEHLLEEARKTYPDLPKTLEEAWRQGIYKKASPDGPVIALKDFRENPEAYPLQTPSGKIEIFSKHLFELSLLWKLPPGDFIPALPEYVPEREGISDPLKEKYPLQMISHHYKQRTHSTYGNVDWLQKVAPQQIWINPLNAEVRGIRHNDAVMVENDRGKCIVRAKVTPRIMPGVVSLPQGAWYRPDSDGVDRGGSANTLTFMKPSPLAKGNPQHSNLVEVRKYE